MLEVVGDATELAEAERWWIAFGRACGWPLTNCTDGGGLSEEALLERRRQEAEWTAVEGKHLRARYSSEEVETFLQSLGIPAEIERRCLQFFDDRFARKRGEKLIDGAVTHLHVTRATATQLYEKWWHLKRQPILTPEPAPLPKPQPKLMTLTTKSPIKEIERECVQHFQQGKSVDEVVIEMRLARHIVRRIYAAYQHLKLGTTIPVS